MIIAKLIEEMTGRDGEFENLSVLLPVQVATDVRDLANKMGVPASRLPIEQPDFPQFNLKGPWDGGPIP